MLYLVMNLWGHGFGAVESLTYPVQKYMVIVILMISCVFVSLFIPDLFWVGGLSVIKHGYIRKTDRINDKLIFEPPRPSLFLWRSFFGEWGKCAAFYFFFYSVLCHIWYMVRQDMIPLNNNS